MHFVKSIYRIYNNPVNPKAEGLHLFLEELASDNPRDIEDFVLRQIPYTYDWNVHNMPWYFPTTKEVLENKKGDCKARFIIIASIFEAFDIPYDLYLSPNHIWINYEGKIETRTESKAVAMFSTGEEFTLKVPELDLQHSREVFQETVIEPMPLEKKNLLFGGIFSFIFLVLMSITVDESFLKLPSKKR